MSGTGASAPRAMDGIPRRTLFCLAAAAASVGLAPTSLWAEAAGSTPSPFAVVLCDLVLPATDTPGAVAAGVPAFLPVALAHHLYGTVGNELDRVRKQLDAAAGQSFMALPAARQSAVLSRLDRDMFALPQPFAAPWVQVKSIILAGYYGSEIGGSKEQLYELVPGRYDPDIPNPPHSRDYSSDWAGVAFR